MRRYLATLALGLLLVGCANTEPTAMTLGQACNSYANALDQLMPLRAAGSLDAKTVAAVDNANALTKPLCAPGTVPDNVPAAISFVAAEASAIYAIVQKGKGA